MVGAWISLLHPGRLPREVLHVMAPEHCTHVQGLRWVGVAVGVAVRRHRDVEVGFDPETKLYVWGSKEWRVEGRWNMWLPVLLI